MVICIIGLGYVGLPLSLAFSQKGLKVIGYDSSLKRINELKKSKDINGEFSKEELMSLENILFTNKTSDIDIANIYIITVPTPINKAKNPNLKPLLKASKTVGKSLSKNDIVIYESTVYPGCTEEECVPVLEFNSKMIFNKDFFCGYSPERINPGDKKRKLKDIVKVTSGSNSETAIKIDKLYKKIIEAGTHLAPSIKVAEASKIIENVQRDVNISLMNELAIIFNKMEIDTTDVLKASSTKWNFLNFKPGLVGGHCIGVDPYYLAYKAKQFGYTPNVILSGRKVNNKMGKHIAETINNLIVNNNKKPQNCNALILGVTFKENCSDIRNSRVFSLHKSLIKLKIKVDLFDPHAINEEVVKSFKIKLIEKINQKYDVIILAVAHDEFLKMDLVNFKKSNGIIYDVKSILDKKIITERL
ncbi:MAG: nucleotide sugar dehydrogenase [Flavobacteriaceae bacterium]|jgi:UDP-N-acetyl-D-galactosamine dehydrogenase|nr:nucleotide sugar dehydrogenase [Flavobacteriaceae bacterium]MBT6689725.1 nucleotide sugar dehydrogenase [Flavobacteriaceae bacterium]MBT7320439.1 nucleotide sugar dehydrogenase [Flavobacteriaceae bacterium]